MSYYDMFLEDVRIPKMVKVQQTFERPIVLDIDKEVQMQIEEAGLMNKLKKGDRVAVGVGSRGITNLSKIVKATVDVLKNYGAKPFIVPTMGSHGGATGEGQKKILASFGITEESMGVEIKASMEVVKIGETDNGISVYFDKNAYGADGSVMIAKIKPHPGFRGAYESGFLKMSVIGFGKQTGAEACHAQGMDKLGENIIRTGKIALEKGNFIFGIGILENAYDETGKIVAFDKDDILEKEPLLLQEAKNHLPRIPFDEIDVLIVDEMGKNISGTGMDTNIIRRYTTPYVKCEPLAKHIAILDLTKEADGNCTGVGLGDVITRRIYEKIIFEKTYPNQITSKVAFSAKIPMVMDSDELCIKVAIKAAPDTNSSNPRVVRIKNTLEIDKIYISENLADQVKDNPLIKIVSEPFDMQFDENGNLL